MSEIVGAHPPENLLAEIRSSFSAGEFFVAYDLAYDAAKRFPEDWWLAHRAVLSLANAGATELASKKFSELHLERFSNTETRSLYARLLKDQGFSESGTKRRRLLDQSRAFYESTFRDSLARGERDSYYPGINAATLALLTDRVTEATALAHEVLAPLATRLATPDEGADKYWVLATAFEAYLIIGDMHEVQRLLPQVIETGQHDYAQLASTARQLERIAEARGVKPEILTGFRMPTVVHYLGHIISPGAGRFPASQENAVRAEIERILDSTKISAAYGSLAAGSDILFAEAMLRRGIGLNIVLPFGIEDFLETSVRTAGKAWVARFHACVNSAKTVRYATEDAYLGDDRLFSYCSQLAMGLAVLLARHTHSPLCQLVVWDGEARSGVAGTVADMKTWQQAGHPQIVIRSGTRAKTDDLATYVRPSVPIGHRDTRAMLFGDIHGFSKLTDAQLPRFTETVMGTVAQVMNRYRGNLSFVNTWGDGIFAVFPDAGQAADCALTMQAALEALDLPSVDLPPTLKLRLGGHLGPIYELPDPVVNRPNYYGAHVSRCARIEPITPEGCVYVTETFAAVLALHNASEFTCDYVGHEQMAKDYGQLRMFLLRRFHGAKGPTVLTDIS